MIAYVMVVLMQPKINTSPARINLLLYSNAIFTLSLQGSINSIVCTGD